MDFIVKTDLSVLPASIEFNAEELKEELAPKLKYYNSLVITEDGIKDAKSDKSKLNKLKAAIEDKRKEIKKQCLAPYEAFEKQCKEIVAMIDEPINVIDSQIKAFDEIRKNQKYVELQEYFEYIGHPDFVQLDSILNPKWGNSTVKIETLKDEIYSRVKEINSDCAEIFELYGNSPNFTAITEKFQSTLDKGQTFIYAAALERQLKNSEKPPEIPQEEPPEIVPPEPARQEAVQIEEKLLTGTFTVTCTKSQLIALRDFMKANNINFKLN